MKGEVIGHHFFSRIEAAAERRKWLGTQHVTCPECRSEQVQLKMYSHSPAEWKCRECQTRFEYEP